MQCSWQLCYQNAGECVASSFSISRSTCHLPSAQRACQDSARKSCRHTLWMTPGAAAGTPSWSDARLVGQTRASNQAAAFAISATSS